MIGGGVFAYMQVKPIIMKIVNELSIDCDRFFDEIADLNQAWLKQQEEEKKSSRLRQPYSVRQAGLSKIIFLNQLSKYGVVVTEQEKALISNVFGLGNADRDKLDYEKIDAAFEGIQQQLYSAGKCSIRLIVQNPCTPKLGNVVYSSVLESTL